MKKLFITFLILFNITIYSYLLGYLTLKLYFDPYLLRTSYISSIKTTSYSVKNIKKSLDKFNEMGNNLVVKYKGVRKITIEEVQNFDFYLKDSATIGLAEVNYTDCKIFLLKNMEDIELEQVLLHEYKHCFGYEHTEDPKDLMYKDYIDPVSENNIQQNALELYHKLYGK